MPARETVFVYGTLRAGASNHFRMAGAEPLGPATVRGRLYRIDWYPGLVIDPEACPVTGELYAVEAAHLQALDAFEGLPPGEMECEEYRRVKVAVAVAGGGREAWVWEWRGPVDEAARIGSGDWCTTGPDRAG